jgi:AmiR/NasT family two-component response regulator
MYSRVPAAFDEQACAVGSVLAAHAAVAMSAAHEREHAEQMGDALRSSREIGMAIGVLMGRSGVTQDEAFVSLRRASQHLHRKLREVAAEVVDTGQLPR